MRNLKALGLALLAVFAMSAVAASSASAETTGGEFTAKNYPATIHGEDGPRLNVFTSLGEELECEATYTGELTEGSPTLTITPHYKNCGTSGGRFATVTTNECDFLFHVGTGTHEPTDWHGTADLVCQEPSEALEIHIYADEAHEKSICTETVPPITGIPVTYTNVGGKVVVHVEEATIPTELHGLCVAGVTTPVHSVYHAEAIVEGLEGNTIDIGTTP